MQRAINAVCFQDMQQRFQWHKLTQNKLLESVSKIQIAF